jgi:hypothetical protein
MTLNVLSLPIDIPWTRIAISPDMYAITEADPLPVKWRSSLAVFSYDPEPDPELTNPDETTTFLKVVATVTGFQPEGAEIDSDVLGPDWSSTVITNYENLTDESYPAYSAIVQLAVFPANGQWTVSQLQERRHSARRRMRKVDGRIPQETAPGSIQGLRFRN